MSEGFLLTPVDAVDLVQRALRKMERAGQTDKEVVMSVIRNWGGSCVALVDAHKLDDYHALGAEHAGLVLVHGALEGLEDLAAGRILSEQELDQALARPPARKR